MKNESKYIQYMKKNAGLKISQDELKTKDIFTIQIKEEKNKFMEPHLLFADRIVYLHDKGKDKMFGNIFDHHLMFYSRGHLVFKVWLPNEKNDDEFKDILEALDKSGIKLAGFNYE